MEFWIVGVGISNAEFSLFAMLSQGVGRDILVAMLGSGQAQDTRSCTESAVGHFRRPVLASCPSSSPSNQRSSLVSADLMLLAGLAFRRLRLD